MTQEFVLMIWCVLHGGSVVHKETVPDRCVQVLCRNLERLKKEHSDFLSPLLFIVRCMLVGITMYVWNGTNCDGNGMRGLEGPPFHDAACTLIRRRKDTRNSVHFSNVLRKLVICELSN